MIFCFIFTIQSGFWKMETGICLFPLPVLQVGEAGMHAYNGQKKGTVFLRLRLLLFLILTVFHNVLHSAV